MQIKQQQALVSAVDRLNRTHEHVWVRTLVFTAIYCVTLHGRKNEIDFGKEQTIMD